MTSRSDKYRINTHAIKSFLRLYDGFDSKYVIRFGQAGVYHNVSKSSVDFDIYLSTDEFDKHFEFNPLIEQVPACGGFPKIK